MTLSLRAWVSVRFLTFYLSWAVFQSYWGLWLAERGFSFSEIGTAVALSLVARTVSVAVIYPALNRYVTLLRLSRIIPWVITAAAVPYLFVVGFPMLLAVSILFGLIYPIMLPLNETVATVAARRGLLLHGPTRALGSAGFMIGTLLAGWLSSALGPEVLVSALIGSCLLAAVVGVVRLREAETLSVRGSGARGFAALFHDRSFLACLAIAVLVQGSHAAYYSFGAIRAEEIAVPIAVPFLLVLAPLSEFVLFSLARRRFEGLGYRVLFALGAVVAAVRWVLLAFAGDAVVFALSQVLHAGSYATTHLAFTMYVRDRVPAEDQSAAQGLYASLAMGLGMAVLTFVAGVQIGIGFATALLSMAVVAVAALLFLPMIRPGEGSSTATAA